MTTIYVNELEAKEQATKISQASDQLSISKTVTFSSNTTVSGNATSQTLFASYSNTPSQFQQLLNRDINNIHSAVEAFIRTDSATSDMINKLLDPSLLKVGN
jgi:type VII secretion effector (TIGR04197 family)